MIPPKDWYEPLVMPGILTFFGLLVYWLGWLKGTASWKWIGIAILAVAAWFGFGYFTVMIGQSPEAQIYRAAMPSIRRYAYAHYAAFFLPVIALIGCIIMQFVKKPALSPTPAE